MCKTSCDSGQDMTIVPAWGRRQRWEFGGMGGRLDCLFGWLRQCGAPQVTCSRMPFSLFQVAEGAAATRTLSNLYPDSLSPAEYTLAHYTYSVAGTFDTTLVSQSFQSMVFQFGE